jgi:hypothetical protein
MVFSTVLLAPVLLLFTGCSSEPSEADMKKAYEAKLAQIKAIPNSNSDLKLYSVKKVACAKAEGNPGYNCDVEVDAENFKVRAKNTLKARFVKGDDGWVVIEENR